jgi:hypothetical protein
MTARGVRPFLVRGGPLFWVSWEPVLIFRGLSEVNALIRTRSFLAIDHMFIYNYHRTRYNGADAAPSCARLPGATGVPRAAYSQR